MVRRSPVSPRAHRLTSTRVRSGKTRAALLVASLAVLPGVLIAAPLVAQTPPQPLGAILADPLVPGGRIRLDFAPSFTRWDTRYGRVEKDGALVDVEESLSADLTDPTGSSLFPGLATLRESIQGLSGQTDFATRLGATQGNVTREITRIDAGLRIGIFDWLTLGVTVPYVKSRAAVEVGFIPDPAANLGVNPYTSDPDAVSALLIGLDDAAGAADARATSLCGAGAGTACDAARSLADRAAAFRDLARAAYLASPFFPVESSPIAGSLGAALAALNGALAGAGLPEVGAQMAFAGSVLDSEGFASIPTDPALRGAPLETTESLWTLGDVEVSGALRLLEGEVRDPGAVSPRFAWMLTGGALVRLPTGAADDPASPFDVASGDGQMDVETRVDAALRVGAHLDLRASARYGVQQAGNVLRRVAPHEAVFPPSYSERTVRWNPGDYQYLEISPRWHLGEALAFAADLRRFHKADDRYEVLGQPVEGLPPVDAADLEHETGMTLYQVAVGLRYSTVALARRGLSDTPLELGARLTRAVSGTGGAVPKTTRVEFSVSLFRRIWGGQAR